MQARRFTSTAVALALTACLSWGCPRNHEAARVPRAQPDSPAEPRGDSAESPSTLERKAGTYDPLVDPEPATGPGAAGTGDTPGTGMNPIDHPVREPEPAPAPTAPAPQR